MVVGSSIKRLFGGILTTADDVDAPKTEQIQRPATAFSVEDAKDQILDSLGRRHESTRLKFQNIVASWDVMNTFHRDLADGFNDIINITANLSDAEKTIFELNMKIENIQGDYLSLKREFTTLASASKVQYDELNLLKARGVADEYKMKSLENEIAASAGVIENSTVEIRSLRSHIEVTDREKHILEQECESLSERIMELDSEKSELLNDRTTLRNRIALEVQERADASKLANALSAKVTEQNKEIASLAAALADLEKHRDAVEAQFKQEKAELSRSLQDHQHRVSALSSEVTALKSAESVFSHKVEALHSRIRVGDQLLQQARDEISRMSVRETEINQLVRDKKLLGSQIAEHEKRQADLEREISRIQEESGERNAQIVSLKGENEKYRSLVVRSEERMNELDKEIRRWEARAQAISDRGEAEISSLKDRLVKQQTETAYLNGIIEAAHGDRIKLQSLIADLRRDASDTMKRKTDIVKQTLNKEPGEMTPLRTPADAFASNVVTIRNPE